mgnify:CR=1 FL=1
MSKSDNSLFIQSDSRGHVFIIIYVDDLVIGGEHLAAIDHWLFEMKNMTELHRFLRIEVIRIPDGIMLSQRHYILNLLKNYKFGMPEYKLVATPFDRDLKLKAKSGTEECEPTLYRQLVGSLIYLIVTRPDLSYPIVLLS